MIKVRICDATEEDERRSRIRWKPLLNTGSGPEDQTPGGSVSGGKSEVRGGALVLLCGGFWNGFSFHVLVASETQKPLPAGSPG